MPQIFVNNASGVVAAGGFAQSATTLPLTDASAFPDPGSDWYYVTLADPAETEWEIVRVTAKSGNNLTVVRAQESTSDIAWDAGDTVEARLTAGSLSNFNGATLSEYKEATDAATLTTNTTLDFADGPIQRLTIDGTVDLTLPSGSGGESLTLHVINTAGSEHSWAVSPTITWMTEETTSTPPTPAADGEITTYAFIWDGVSLLGYRTAPATVAAEGGLNVVSFPAAADSTGAVGDIAFSSNYIAVCLATDTWYFFPASAVRPTL